MICSTNSGRFTKEGSKPPSPSFGDRTICVLLKVLALLQDTDPPLAAAIVASREAIWGILADPDKFTTL